MLSEWAELTDGNGPLSGTSLIAPPTGFEPVRLVPETSALSLSYGGVRHLSYQMAFERTSAASRSRAEDAIISHNDAGSMRTCGLS